jgi:hypothetical protein
MTPFPIRLAVGPSRSGEKTVELMPIDLTAVISVVMGISVVLIPVIGLTARFALKPTVEALSRIFEGKGRDETVQMLERRVALLEQQLDAVESSVGRLEETSRFDAALHGPEDQTSARISPPSGSSDPLDGPRPEGS